jgi:hypothetical protein
VGRPMSWARPPSLIASARRDWMYRHGARRNMVEDLALAAQGKQGVNIEAPDRRKLVADCSDLAATDRVMEKTSCGTEAGFKSAA